MAKPRSTLPCVATIEEAIEHGFGSTETVEAWSVPTVTPAALAATDTVILRLERMRLQELDAAIIRELAKRESEARRRVDEMIQEIS